MEAAADAAIDDGAFGVVVGVVNMSMLLLTTTTTTLLVSTTTAVVVVSLLDIVMMMTRVMYRSTNNTVTD